MTEQNLEKFIKFILDPDYVVVWNDGYDKYIILNNYVYNYNNELKVYFKQFREKYIDLHSCVSSDFIFLKKEEEL